MRKLAVAMLALPVLAFVYLSACLKRSIVARAGLLTLAVALVVAGLIVGLPAKPAGAKGPATFAPLSPSSYSVKVENNLPLRAPVRIDFTKAMNETDVAMHVTVQPTIPMKFAWSDDGKSMSITAQPNWSPVTYYSIDIPGSVLGSDGVALGQPVHVVFVTGTATQGQFSATVAGADAVAVTTAFQLTFDRPVPIATVAEEFRITPDVAGSLSGDDPTDAHSQVFTFTPSAALAPNARYTLSFESGGVDTSGALLAPVAPFTVTTAKAPEVVRFRPLDKATDVDPGQGLSVRFTMPMDTPASTAAFSATVNGKPIAGKLEWAEDDTVLVLTPSEKLAWSATVEMNVSTAAMSKTGSHLQASVTATFTVADEPPKAPPPSTNVPVTPPSVGPIADAPWYGWEVYSLQLLNCTRTGGWVNGNGSCSLGANRWGSSAALALDPGISSKVARPYAKYMADRNILDHFAYGTPGTRLAAQGYTSYKWAENIAWPYASDSGMVAVATFFQNEAPCSSCHFANIMNGTYDRVGIGVWVERGRAWVVFDFYHP